MPDIYLKSRDHPQARGRTAKPGEEAWEIDIPLEDGSRLTLAIGSEGYKAIRAVVGMDEQDQVLAIIEQNFSPYARAIND